MKIQLEQLDLTQPWPRLALRPGYHAVRVLAFVGTAPLGDVMCRPARTGVVSYRGLRKRIARRYSVQLLRLLAREGLAAGPEALRGFAPELKSSTMLSWFKWRATASWVEQNLLLKSGLPAPYRDWVAKGQGVVNHPLPPVTVVVCTRDRAEALAACIESLKRLDYSTFEILIADNSRDPLPTRRVVEDAGATYMRVPTAGLSRARNAALAATTTRWAAFTDDDCRPEPNWLRELVRPLQDTNCVSVTGLVLPATLENAAEITFELYGGLGRGYQSKAFDGWSIHRARLSPVPTWRFGAGANMLVDARLVLEMGGYDVDLGAGAAAPCSEDTDVWYRMLRRGHTVHYTPRAIVHHHHRSSPEALRQQISAYAKGHAAYHWKCFWGYRDYRSMVYLLYKLPRWFRKNMKMGMRGKTDYPFTLIFLEIRGTLAGPVVYTMAKARRFVGSMRDALRRRLRPSRPLLGDLIVPRTSDDDSYDVNAPNQSVRVA